ncbi:MAG: hypothetical protein LHW59_04075 [Candidatus Cloacimonetes bacterium]|nr:hypothetical protein [Candidatus Cloacimonadota bacterium]
MKGKGWEFARIAGMVLFLFINIGLWANSRMSTDLAAKRFTFEMENLHFDLSDSLLAFDGLFTFYNIHKESINRNIYFPIPVDDKQMDYEGLSVTLLDNNVPLPVKKSANGFWFELEMEERSMATVRICYQQRLLAKEAKYILLTANSWGNPLTYAKYQVSLPSGAHIIQYPFHNDVKKQVIDGQDLRIWTFENFVPDRDFLIKWE